MVCLQEQSRAVLWPARSSWEPAHQLRHSIPCQYYDAHLTLAGTAGKSRIVSEDQQSVKIGRKRLEIHTVDDRTQILHPFDVIEGRHLPGPNLLHDLRTQPLEYVGVHAQKVYRKR